MKTACEEAADEFAALDRAGILELLPDEKGVSSTLIKRLRAEGRELKRLRGLIFGAFGAGRSVESIYKSTSRLHDEAARIQKARKAK